MKIVQIIKLIDIKAIVLAFLAGVVAPLLFIQLALFSLSTLGSTNAYLEGIIPLYVVYFIVVPFLLGYIASRLAKQLPCYHGVGVVLTLAIVAYAQSEPIYWWVGVAQLAAHTITGVAGAVIAIQRPRASVL